ncbi:MAG: PEP-CTERM sorting domain-containing protein [Isosphaerales bacterium]
MERMCSIIARVGLVAFIVLLGDVWSPARGDLIRSNPSRSFPDIAGDIVGAQTYTYDPVTQTGTFQVVNAPHLIALGPSVKDMVHMLPEQDGTLSQFLRMKLDRNGRLIESPYNKFQIRGTVVIGDRTYEGSLLEGRPTAFGAEAQDGSPAKNKNAEVFDLNVEITGGQLAGAFGPEAYLRITPQAKSTFNGQFTADFSSEKPLTNLRAWRKGLPAAVPEPTALLTLLTCGAGLLACRLRRYLTRARHRRGDA